VYISIRDRLVRRDIMQLPHVFSLGGRSPPAAEARPVARQEYLILEPGESLHLIVEASLALAGFAGVITVLAKRGARELPPLYRLSLVNLLATSLGALFSSLAALVMLAAGIGQPLVWRTISGIGLLVTLYFSYRSFVAVVSAGTGERQGRSMATLLVINSSLLCVCVVQVWNILYLGEFWPVLLLLVALFAVGCYSFVLLLFSPSA
jgi:hypothetical protein